MDPQFQLVAPDRLRIREGGGCLSIFGLVFFAAGVFLVLTIAGVVPVSNASELSALDWGVLILMGVACTTAGGALAFGRGWTIVDRSERTLIKQWGLMVPMHERIVPLQGYSVIMLGFVEGDSDTSDTFPIALGARGGPHLPLCSFTDYAQARACARALAEHLQLELEDASTDHPVRMPAGHTGDIPFQERLRRDGALLDDAVRPPNARSQVTRDRGGVTIVIPVRRMHALVLATAPIPLAIPLVIGPPLATFFRESQTPDPVAWAFLGFLTLFFGILPTTVVVGGFLRSRRGATIVKASKEGLQVQERGAWATRTIAALDAPDILDVDYSSHESSVASARRAVEQRVQQSHPSASATVSPRVERMVDKITRFVKGRGVIVKARSGLTTFGRELDDEEVRYLHAVVRRALIE